MLKVAVLPGVVVGALAVCRIDSPDTVTVEVHRLSPLPLGQFVPTVEELTVFASTLLPRSGLFTTTE